MEENVNISTKLYKDGKEREHKVRTYSATRYCSIILCLPQACSSMRILYNSNSGPKRQDLYNLFSLLQSSEIPIPIVSWLEKGNRSVFYEPLGRFPFPSSRFHSSKASNNVFLPFRICRHFQVASLAIAFFCSDCLWSGLFRSKRHTSPHTSPR